MASITLNHIDKTYDDGFHAIKDVNLEIEDGEYIIAVEADGNWSFTPMTEEEYESASSDS